MRTISSINESCRMVAFNHYETISQLFMPYLRLFKSSAGTFRTEIWKLTSNIVSSKNEKSSHLTSQDFSKCYSTCWQTLWSLQPLEQSQCSTGSRRYRKLKNCRHLEHKNCHQRAHRKHHNQPMRSILLYLLSMKELDWQNRTLRMYLTSCGAQKVKRIDSVTQEEMVSVSLFVRRSVKGLVVTLLLKQQLERVVPSNSARESTTKTKETRDN